MKIKKYTDVKETHFENTEIKGVSVRVVIGKDDGASNFWMRVFNISPGGNTPRHSHDWEHEIFVYSGEGEIYGNSKWNPVKSGDVLIIPGNEEHEIRNYTNQSLIIICLVPSKAPESVVTGNN